MKSNLKEVRNTIQELIDNKELSYQEKYYLLENSISTLNYIKATLISNIWPCDMCIDNKTPQDRYCKYCWRKLKNK